MALTSSAIPSRRPPPPPPRPSSASSVSPASTSFATSFATSSATPDEPGIYNGRAGQLVAKIPRLDADIEVDGTLTAPAWAHAAVLTGFSEYQPVDGQPAQDSTDV